MPLGPPFPPKILLIAGNPLEFLGINLQTTFLAQGRGNSRLDHLE